MKGLWHGFEKRAVTNKKIFRSYVNTLLSVLHKSSDPTDRAVHRYLSTHLRGLEKKIPEKVRERGEAPAINWVHNVRPEKIRKMVQDANENKHKPGWARAEVLKAVAGG
jgi:lysyl-tRNA synthetase class I